MIRRILKIFAILLVASGMLFLSYPFINEHKHKAENKKVIEEFNDLRDKIKIPDLNYAELDNIDEYIDNNELTIEQVRYLRLYKSFAEYNKRIYNEEQKTLCDAFSYTTNDFDMSAEDISDDMIGYLNIPAMEQELPLFIGANQQNMAKGATVLSQTSMPIGGNNTNCVIAAHRGYRGISMFLDIEKLQVGDSVKVVNLWEELDYTVIGLAVIDPYDVDAIKIVRGYDMVTLITCHPYSKNYQRYVVYCVRDEELEKVYNSGSYSTVDELKPIFEDLSTQPVTESSSDDIKLEKTLFKIGFCICAVLLVYILYSTIRDAIIRKRKHRF